MTLNQNKLHYVTVVSLEISSFQELGSDFFFCSKTTKQKQDELAFHLIELVQCLTSIHHEAKS